MPAPAPTRSTGSFSISFGLLNIPVNLYTATEAVKVSRTQWTKDGQKVGNLSCVKNDDGSYGRAVERSEIVKKYETERGLVELSDDELDALGTVTPGVADLLGVQPVAFLHDGRYVPNGQVWQVRAAKLGSGRQAKPNPGGQKAFALLLAALKAEHAVALLRFAKAGTVYHAALLHTGELIGLYCDAELREQVDLPQPDLVEEEVDLARQLLRAAKSRTPILLENELVDRVKTYAEEKAAGELPAGRPELPQAAAVVDLMAQLKASVEAAKAAV